MSITARRSVIAAVLVVGAVVLSIDLRLPQGSTEFLVLGVALALVWSTPTLLFGPSGGRGRSGPWGDLALGALGGGVMYGVFVAGQAIGEHISWLDGPIRHILDKADAGPSVLITLVAMVNGVAEELFFRGSLTDALDPRRPRAHVIAFVTYVVVTALGRQHRPDRRGDRDGRGARRRAVVHARAVRSDRHPRRVEPAGDRRAAPTVNPRG